MILSESYHIYLNFRVTKIMPANKNMASNTRLRRQTERWSSAGGLNVIKMSDNKACSVIKRPSSLTSQLSLDPCM